MTQYRIKTAEEMQSDFGTGWERMFPQLSEEHPIETILGRELSAAELEDILHDYSFIHGYHICERHITPVFSQIQ